jgi:serine/threonine protein kinase
VSTFVCPSCSRSFVEAGFCPYDGSALGAGGNVSDSAPTVLNVRDLAAHTARTQVRTMTMPQFGNTVETSPPAAPLTTDTAPRARAELPTQKDPVLAAAVPDLKPPKPALRAVSAHDDPGEALSKLGRRGTVYDQLVGQTLDGRYFIERKIGEGGMGVVYSAKHSVIERPLAIKVLKREALRDAATITRFVQEAKAASRIGHPNIVDVTDFGTTPEGLTYSVMEYVKGITLALVVKTQAPLPVARAAAIAQQLARALGAAHEKGIVHRDLKPENIFLVDRDGRPDFVKIVDFGIAKVTPIDGTAAGPRLTRAGSVFGTPEYMAPEQAAGRSDIDGRVDIYALGIILYEMITGKLPLKGDSTVRTIAMQLLDPIVPPTQIRPDLEIGPECEAIVMKALAKRRDERYRTMAELQAALEQLLRHRPARAPGQPVVGLAPLPPGADPRVVESLPMYGSAPQVLLEPAAPSAPIVADPSRPYPASGAREPSGLLQPRARRPSESSLGAGTGSSRAHRPSQGPLGDGSARAHRPSEAPPPGQRSVRDEPEFVKIGVSSFEHVYLDLPVVPPRRRWPLLVAALAVAVGVGVTIALMSQHQGRPALLAATASDARRPEPPEVRSGDDEDARAAATAPDREPGAATLDGGEGTEGSGAVGSGGSRPPRPGGHHDRRDARSAESHRQITVQILTYPEDGTVYRGRTYRGPGGTTVQEDFGTVARFTCTKVGYKEGYIDVKFDDKTPIAVCVMTRKKVCVDDLKNPYDHCPDAGPAGR